MSLKSSRRALGGWVVGGLLAGLTVMPICDLHFDCGCRWPGFGGYAHCDIHTAGPPDCPWCDRPGTMVLSMLFSYGFGLGGALWASARRFRVFYVALASFAAIVAGTFLTGIVTSWILGLPALAGL